MFRLSCALLPTLIPLFLFAGFYFPDDPDLGYHLSIGYQVIADKAVPTVDSFRANSNVPEIAYSWLADISLAALYQQSGVVGLKCWIVYSVLLLAIVLGLLLAERCSVIESAVMLAVSSVALFQVVGPRPRLWSVLLFALFLIIVRGHTESNKYNRPTWLASLLLLIVLWTNVHVSVFAAVPVLALIGFGRFVEFKDFSAVRDTLVLMMVVCIGICANPYGIGYFSLLESFAPGGQAEVASKIVELIGVFSLPNPKPIWFWAGVILILGWLSFIAQRISEKRHPEREAESIGLVAPTLVACAFLVLSSLSSRHFCFFVVSALFSVGRPREGAILPSSAVSIMGIAIAILGLGAGVSQSIDANTWYERNATAYYPAPALESVEQYLSEDVTAGRKTIVAPFVVGHFTTWWLREHDLLDRAGIYLDGRTDKLGRERFLPVYEFFKGIGFAEFVKRVNPDVVLVPERSPLRQLLSKSSQFAMAGGGRYKAFYRVVEQ